MHEKIALAGWDANVATDSRGTAILTEWLSSDPKQRFRPDINTNDKTPNFDGYVEFGVQKGNKTIPVGRVNVQVKSTRALPNASNGQLKYDCKTEIFAAVLHRISCDPSALVIVDVVHEKCYWKDLTPDYIESLNLSSRQQKKTISLSASDLLDDYDELYRRIERQYRETVDRLTGAFTAGIITSGEVGTQRLVELQLAHEHMTDRLATDLRFLRKLCFADVWTIALGYGEAEEGYILAILPVRLGENGASGVRDVGLGSNHLFCGFTLTVDVHTDPPLSRAFPSDYPITKAIDDLLVVWVEEFAETQVIHPRFMSDVMLSESMFFCADLISQNTMGLLSSAESPNLFTCDRMSPRQCHKLYDGCYRSVVEGVRTALGAVSLEDSIVEVELFGVNALEDNSVVAKRIADHFCSEEDMAFDGRPHVRLSERVVPFALMKAVVEEIERRGLTVERPWKHSSKEDLDARCTKLTIGAHRDAAGAVFDLTTARADYVANYEKLMRLVRDESLALEQNYFGAEPSWDEHLFTKYALNIDDLHATTSFVCYRVGKEGYTLDVLPLNSSEPLECLRSAEDTEGDICRVGSRANVPTFNGRRPLYVEVLRRIMSLIAIKCPEVKLRSVTLESDLMPRRVTLDGGHMIISDGLTIGVGE